MEGLMTSYDYNIGEEYFKEATRNRIEADYFTESENKKIYFWKLAIDNITKAIDCGYILDGGSYFIRALDYNSLGRAINNVEYFKLAINDLNTIINSNHSPTSKNMIEYLNKNNQ